MLISIITDKYKVYRLSRIPFFWKFSMSGRDIYFVTIYVFILYLIITIIIITITIVGLKFLAKILLLFFVKLKLETRMNSSHPYW